MMHVSVVAPALSSLLKSTANVLYRYDRPPVPQATTGNALDIGIFDASGHQLGTAGASAAGLGGSGPVHDFGRHSHPRLPAPVRSIPAPGT